MPSTSALMDSIFAIELKMGGQEIIALIDGDEESIGDFRKLVETKKPEHARISTVAFEDYGGEVMRAGEYSQVCTAMQLNKAIPILLDMNGKMDNMLDKQDQSTEEIRGLRVDIIKHER
jgi:hypothetical protein